MQQRVGVVRALANEPDVLLMDEPFASVDAQTRMTLQEELTRIWQDEAADRHLHHPRRRRGGVPGEPRRRAVEGPRARARSRVDLPRPRAWDALHEDATLQGAHRPRAAAGAFGMSHVARRAQVAQDARAARASRVCYLAWQLWLTLAAPAKIAGLPRRTPSGSTSWSTLPFPPERFHVQQFQTFGRVSGTQDNAVEVRGVKRADLASLARPYWVKRVEPLPPGG